MALAEVHGRTHDERALVGRGRALIELGPIRDAPSGRGVEQDDGCIGVQRLSDVGLGRRAGACEVEARDHCEDRRPGAEPVVAIPFRWVDRDAHGVAGHRVGRELHAPVGVGRAVGHGEVVVRERIEALGRVEEVADAVRVDRSLLRGAGVRDALYPATGEERHQRRAGDAAQTASHTIRSSAGGSPSISAGLCLSMCPMRPL